MGQASKFDVIILGGGPAGSCAALKLLNLGYKVALLEKECFPRKQIGESLSPGIWNIFDYLQAKHLLEKSVYLHGLPAKVIWETKTPNSLSSKHRGPSVIVDRSILDSDLINLAVARGLHLFQPVKFESCLKVEEDWQLMIRHGNSVKLLLGTFILDARGSGGIKHSNRVLTAPLSIALWTHISSDIMPSETIIEALDNGWLWGAPMPSHQFRVMAFVDPAQLKESQPVTILNSLLCQSELFRSGIKNYYPENIKACLSSTYFHSNPWNNNYVKLGESAFSLDPLSSSGVEKAMRFSLQAVIAVNTVLKKGKERIAKSFYEERIIDTVAVHTSWTKDYYAKAWPGSTNIFWRDRSTFFLNYNKNHSNLYKNLVEKLKENNSANVNMPEFSQDSRKAIFSLWNEKVKVSDSLTYIETPCIVDDYIEVKTAIKHPCVEREFAYLDQVEIAPLLKLVEQYRTIGNIVYQWSAKISYEKAIRIAFYLWSLGIICKQTKV